jgi:hypothetical protein
MITGTAQGGACKIRTTRSAVMNAFGIFYNPIQGIKYSRDFYR